MTEEILRDILMEAQKKSQQGLIIWDSWSTWDYFGNDMKPGNPNYDFSLSQISDGKEAFFGIDLSNLSTPGFMAISVEKLLKQDSLLSFVLSICNDGPITFIPSNELSDKF